MLRRTFASAAAAQKTGRERLRPSAALFQHREAIRRIVAAHGASDPRVFGSVLLGTDTEASDLDLLVEPDPGFTLFGVAGIMTELQGELTQVPVDVTTPGALPLKWRDKVLAETQSI